MKEISTEAITVSTLPRKLSTENAFAMSMQRGNLFHAMFVDSSKGDLFVDFSHLLDYGGEVLLQQSYTAFINNLIGSFKSPVWYDHMPPMKELMATVREFMNSAPMQVAVKVIDKLGLILQTMLVQSSDIKIKEEIGMGTTWSPWSPSVIDADHGLLVRITFAKLDMLRTLDAVEDPNVITDFLCYIWSTFVEAPDYVMMSTEYESTPDFYQEYTRCLLTCNGQSYTLFATAMRDLHITVSNAFMEVPDIEVGGNMNLTFNQIERCATAAMQRIIAEGRWESSGRHILDWLDVFEQPAGTAIYRTHTPVAIAFVLTLPRVFEFDSIRNRDGVLTLKVCYGRHLVDGMAVYDLLVDNEYEPDEDEEDGDWEEWYQGMLEEMIRRMPNEQTETYGLFAIVDKLSYLVRWSNSPSDMRFGIGGLPAIKAGVRPEVIEADTGIMETYRTILAIHLPEIADVPLNGWVKVSGIDTWMSRSHPIMASGKVPADHEVLRVLRAPKQTGEVIYVPYTMDTEWLLQEGVDGELTYLTSEQVAMIEPAAWIAAYGRVPAEDEQPSRIAAIAVDRGSLFNEPTVMYRAKGHPVLHILPPIKVRVGGRAYVEDEFPVLLYTERLEFDFNETIESLPSYQPQRMN